MSPKQKLLERAFKLSLNVLQNVNFLELARLNISDFTRTRKMSFAALMVFLLSNPKAAAALSLRRYFSKIGSETNMTQQSFSEARQKINPTAFEFLFEQVSQMLYKDKSSYKTYHGWRLLAIDGSTLALPASRKFEASFGCSSGSGLTSPTARISISYDVLNDVVLHGLIDKYRTSERLMAYQHLEQHKPISGITDLFMFDRGYPSRKLINALNAKKHLFLMRVSRKFNLNVDAADKSDSLVNIGNTESPMLIRVIKLVLPSGEQEVLLTNVYDLSLGVDDFRELYAKRWCIETQYDKLKNKLAIENVTGRTEIAIKQDFYISLYLANMVAFATADANEANVDVSGGDNNSERKYFYQVRVNYAIGVFRDDFIKAILENSPRKQKKLVQKIIDDVRRATDPIRPNRSFPRKNHSRDAKFHHNFKPAT